MHDMQTHLFNAEETRIDYLVQVNISLYCAGESRAGIECYNDTPDALHLLLVYL